MSQIAQSFGIAADRALSYIAHSVAYSWNCPRSGIVLCRAFCGRDAVQTWAVIRRRSANRGRARKVRLLSSLTSGLTPATPLGRRSRRAADGTQARRCIERDHVASTGNFRGQSLGIRYSRGPWPRLAVSAERSQAGILGGAGKRPPWRQSVRVQCRLSFRYRDRPSLCPGQGLSDARNFSVAYLEAI